MVESLFLTAREIALAAARRPSDAVRLPVSEPAPDFQVDRGLGCIIWGLNGLRLVHSPQIAALADIFADNGWIRNFNALFDAELALSEVEPPAEPAARGIARTMLARSLGALGSGPEAA